MSSVNLKTAKQIGESNGKAERLVIAAIRRLGLQPDFTQQHAGRIAKYYGSAAQQSISSYLKLSHRDKLSLIGPTEKALWHHREPVPLQAKPRAQWTASSVGTWLGSTKAGVLTLLRLHGFTTFEAFAASEKTLEWLSHLYQQLPGESAYLKGRALVKLSHEAGWFETCTKAQAQAAQQQIIKQHDAALWATRSQAAGFLGKNETTTYALYKHSGFRFEKDHAVLFYSWEDLKTLKSLLLTRQSNSHISEVLRERLALEGFEFTTEKTFSDLALKKPLRFDFCLSLQRVLIEVQGQQHFKLGLFSGFGKSAAIEEQKALLEAQQNRDTLKLEYAKANGWDLLWVSNLSDVSDVVGYLKSLNSVQLAWPKTLVEDYGYAALSHFNGDTETFCWLHRGHFPYHRAGSLLKQIHKSYWKAHNKGKRSPYYTWTMQKEAFQRLVQNRLKYLPGLAKAPAMLKIPALSSLLAGFAVSKISAPVSFFSVSFATELLQQFSNTSLVVDPFSGFSGRALACSNLGKQYKGFDIDPEHVAETRQAIKKLGMQGVEVSAEDIEKAPIRNWPDAVLLTCPPYGDKELWSDELRETHSEDYWISLCLRKHICNRYVFVVGNTRAFSRFEMHLNQVRHISFYSKGHRQVLVIDRAQRDSLLQEASSSF